MLPYKDEIECHHYPIVNTLLIAINIVVFTYQTVAIHNVHTFFYDHGTVATRFVHHFDLQQLGTIFTSMFLHGGFGHIIGNLWVLYLFGDNVEDRLGHFKYLAFYLACGVAADATQILNDLNLAVPAIGASGAIAGVLGAYMMLYPRVGVRTWITWFWFMTIPAWVIIGGWFILQCISSALPSIGQEIAWYAHIGGFLAGISLVYGLKAAKPPEFIDIDGVRCRTSERDGLHNDELLKSNNLVTAIGTTIFLLFIFVAGFMAMNHHSARPAAAPLVATKTSDSTERLPKHKVRIHKQFKVVKSKQHATH